ncbi:LysE family translocator [Agrobacterium genomosp. 3]|uniref:LysE family translocator n=1 Tax=Agrobacterium tomkonis TaxID=1183410 RepID=UPI001CD83129|nr:LysE family translocator [Agrobacterium tomkonis]MCA1879093.1 LysE family translocator [Agrobacterium tumefaciens]MCA1894320.1 LysE family translocator [Agrobacterium tomkonis]MCA2379883.1 LysE family translocator [Agrobacterium tomkonis RTP8]
MSYAENLWLFFLLLFGIIILPGMDMLFVLASALTGGKKTGLSAASGMSAGGIVHSLYGAAGVGLLATWMPSLFLPLLIAGAAYMVWIGIGLMRSAIVVNGDEAQASASVKKAFWRAVLTCLSNPKAYLFMMAVYPQFLKPAYGPIWMQGLVMGAMVAVTQFTVYGALALTADKSRQWLVSSPGATIFIGRAAGFMLVAAALLTFWEALSWSLGE